MAEQTGNISILPILKKIPLLSDLNEDDHKEIINHIDLLYFPAHKDVFHEGDPGDAVYIIKRGIVRIYHPGPTKADEKDIAMLGDDDFFGEMAIISEKPRNSSAESIEESEIFILKKEDFIKLVSSNPNMASRISSEFLKRLKINLKGKED